MIILRLILCIILAISVDCACQSCVMDMTVSGVFGFSSAPTKQLSRFDSPALNLLAVQTLLSALHNHKRVVTSMPTNSNYNIRLKRRAWAGGLFIEEISENDDSLENGVEGEEISEESADSKSGAGEEVMSESMIMAIGFYKQWISPLLPPACRFLPTCSQYGVQAIKEFGPTKGTILTAWRLARCSPFGGRGYDPPRWPPVSYTYGSY